MATGLLVTKLSIPFAAKPAANLAVNFLVIMLFCGIYNVLMFQ